MLSPDVDVSTGLATAPRLLPHWFSHAAMLKPLDKIQKGFQAAFMLYVPKLAEDFSGLLRALQG